MQVPHVILNFLIATLRNKKIQVKLILTMLYLGQYIQNITISTCNQCKNYIYIFEGYYFSYIWCILHFQHISIYTSHFKCQIATCSWLLSGMVQDQSFSVSSVFKLRPLRRKDSSTNKYSQVQHNHKLQDAPGIRLWRHNFKNV